MGRLARVHLRSKGKRQELRKNLAEAHRKDRERKKKSRQA